MNRSGLWRRRPEIAKLEFATKNCFNVGKTRLLQVTLWILKEIA